jgi:hypothetical protein
MRISGRDLSGRLRKGKVPVLSALVLIIRKILLDRRGIFAMDGTELVL